MQRFDSLNPSTSLKGPHLLEASAGTGKTFAVQQIFVRLLLESDLDLEQILVITFTRAATRELKERIRSNLEKALHQLETDAIEWPHIEPFRKSRKAIQKLRDALSLFDRSQIFTIHGFCHRMLKEFSFEAKRPVAAKDWDKTETQFPEKLQSAVLDFLLHLPNDLLCPEQLSLLYKKRKSAEKLAKDLLKESMKEQKPGKPFSSFYETYVSLMSSWKLNFDELAEDFSLLEKNYKVEVKGNFLRQLRALANGNEPEAFRSLLAEKGSIFTFLSLENRKVKAAPLSTKSDPFFAWGQIHLRSLIIEAMDAKQLFKTLAYEWAGAAKRLMKGEDLIDPDAILRVMHESLARHPSFLRLVQKKYKAAIIDEFQDTDPLQWEIFQTLFLGEETSAESVFLVGDPKQSIYRFRNADIYTYLKAKEHLDPSQHYCLDVNFRSSKSLIDALNTLFIRPWLALPKLGTFLPYHPVSSGAKGIESFEDGKCALHFFAVKDGSLTESEKLFFPFIAKEIAHLQKETGSFSSFAVLVKDRYQASRIAAYLEKRNIPTVTKNQDPLGETFAFQALFELLQAIIDPKDQSKSKRVLLGPLARIELASISLETSPIFYELKAVLQEQGLARFFPTLFSAKLGQHSVLQAIACEDADFYRDFFHAVELLLEYERREGFSLEHLLGWLKKISFLDVEEDSRVRQKACSDDEAVQVMTMHVSKGLEFDVVFALGLLAPSPKPDEEKEELEAEKSRQLYVAMTRAKRRLYVPLQLLDGSPDTDGTASPISLFMHRLQEGKPLEEILEQLSSKGQISWEMGSETDSFSFDLPKTPFSPASFTPPSLHITPCYLHSFTSLARKTPSDGPLPPCKEGATLHTLPRGADVGIFLHELLEDIFSSSHPLWKNLYEVKQTTLQKIQNTKWTDWTEAIQELMVQIVSLPFFADLDPKDVRVEVEFMFRRDPHFIKGFIDLVFRENGRIYLVDWKSNWLGEDNDAYSYQAISESMRANDYELQASLYAEALKCSFPGLEFGGSYYIFLRGIHSLTQGIFFFQPRGSDDSLAR